MSEAESREIVERLDKLNEFERQPVTPDKLHSGRHFAGVFAGEHVAATEFVIGALFVSQGAHTCDVIVGLIFGNLLAVLSWALICAPIAVETRLTLYWYLRKIGGPIVMIVYNILNAVMYCILAGAMITVSASAVRIPFGIEPQTGWFPTDFRFVLVVLGVGAVVVMLAILGFKKLAQFAEVCSPWMFLMFIAGALALLPAIVARTPEIKALNSFYDFWQLADAKIWPGPKAGETGLGFLHIASFAWIANLAMHLGLSDMALFRYAKKASYGFYSAFGMYLGHYLAWICAGIMGAGAALVVQQPLTDLDSGAVATQALGLVGAIAVVIAGWTTSNPTIYRAGLALQAATPNWPRWFVTLIAGAVTTIVACSPFVFTKLLDFVGYYGLLLMPIGAIVTTEHWIFPRLGLTRYWVERKRKLVNRPALLAWGITLAGIILFQEDGPLYKLFNLLKMETIANFFQSIGFLHLFLMIIPVWLCASILYIIFAYREGAAEKLPQEETTPAAGPEPQPQVETSQKYNAPVKKSPIYYISGTIALIALAMCFFLALWVSISSQDNYQARHDSFKIILIWVTTIYFISGTIWFILKEKGEPDS